MADKDDEEQAAVERVPLGLITPFGLPAKTALGLGMIIVPLFALSAFLLWSMWTPKAIAYYVVDTSNHDVIAGEQPPCSSLVFVDAELQLEQKGDPDESTIRTVDEYVAQGLDDARSCDLVTATQVIDRLRLVRASMHSRYDHGDPYGDVPFLKRRLQLCEAFHSNSDCQSIHDAINTVAQGADK